MSRITYVWRDGQLVEKSKARPLESGPFLMPDIETFQTQDGIEISSRSALREYERKNGVRQLGNDRPDGIRRAEWAALEQRILHERRKRRHRSG